MTNIVNNDKLIFILTNYGLQRIAEALHDPTVVINITKGKVGNANGEYYEPNETQVSLINPIPNGEFPIIQKELLEDNLTSSFLFKMPESFGNCDIREVGLYETVDDIDYLFAIGTHQPIVKPSVNYNYLIFIDYYIMLKASNLANVYDQIVINPDNQIITELDLQNLMSSIVFTQGNLSNQIEKNSHLIGLNRGTLLYENIRNSQESYSYTSAAELFSNLARISGSNNIFSFWVFNYSYKNVADHAIVDLSINKNNLSCNNSLNLYNQKYNGLLSALTFSNEDYYYLGSEIPLIFTNDNDIDIPFAILYAIEPLSYDEDRTILARSNYATNTHAFEVNELTNGSLQVKLFSDSNNYLTFTSPVNAIPKNKHSVILYFNNSSRTIETYINGTHYTLNKVETGAYNNMSTTPTTLYAFSYDTSKFIYADSGTSPTVLYNSDGSPYTLTAWNISDGKVYYESTEASYLSSANIQTDTLYAWTYVNSPLEYIIYTKSPTISENTVLYNADYTQYTGSDFTVTLVGGNYIVQYNSNSTTYDESQNIEPKTLYAWKYTGSIDMIWANSSTSPVILFDSNGNLYEGDIWSIQNGSVIYNNEGTATYSSTSNITIAALEVTSYITNLAGDNVNNINSNISIISVIRNKNFSLEELRVISLLIESSIGNNPCFSLQ